jgi:predicted dienelactone hydrolase
MMNAYKLLVTVAFGFAAASAQAAGLRLIDIPADAGGPALQGAMWYPCSQPPGEVTIGKITLPAAKDCPLRGDRLPLIVVSHGRGGTFVGHHDTDEVLADAGFVVVAINHPGDTAADLSRSGDLSVFVERPTDIKRLIDFMIGASSFAANIDSSRIGFFGFSRGGYTGLVLVGGNPDWANATRLCQQSKIPLCQQILRKEYPATPLTHDARIKAAVIADPHAVFFTAASLVSIEVPIQLWASERGGDGVELHQVAAVDQALPIKHEYRVVANAGHFAFLSPCPAPVATELPQLCADAAGFDRVAFRRQLDRDVLTFFRAHLDNGSR